MDLLARADRLRVRAYDHAIAGRPATAERLFVRALGVLDTSKDVSPGANGLRSRVLMGLAFAVADQRTLDDGLGYLQQARAAALHSDDPALAPMLEIQHANMLTTFGRPSEGLDHLDAAAVDIDFLDTYNQCALLLNRSVVHLDRGDLTAAGADLARCVDLARAGEIAEMEFKARCNLGYVEFLSGDLPAALATMAAAAQLDVDVQRGVLNMDRAVVLTEAGLIREAEETLAGAEAEFARLRAFQDRAEAELARADCALIGQDAATAIRLARRAERRFRARGSDRWAAVAALTALQAEVSGGRTRRGQADDALALRAELLERGQPGQARSAGLLAAELLARSGRAARAQQLLEEIGPASGSDRIGVRIQARVVAAQVADAAGDRVSARRAINKGIAEIASHQASFGSLDLKTAAAVHGSRLSQLHLDLALADGRPGVVFDAVEKVRAISNRLPAVRPPEDERTAELLADLRGVIEGLRGLPGPDAAPLRRRRRELEREIAARSWTVAGERGQSRPASYRDVRAELAERGTRMAAFIGSHDQLSAVVVGAGRSSVVPLGPVAPIDELLSRIRADLDALALGSLPAPLRAAVTSSLTRSLAAFDARVLAPIGAGPDPLVVISGGAFAAVPWGCVPSLLGVPVNVAPSATAWLRARRAMREHPRSATPGVVAFAGPALLRAEDEAVTVGATWTGGRAVVGAEATTAALAEALGSADVVHVAAHGRHEPQNPLFSSIRMADGVLFAHDLGYAERPAAHVVLSACDLGLATIRPGDEALGLTSVLLHHGARSVIAGVARVDDDVAARTMSAYHRALAGGASAAEALASVVTAGSAPAPFVCFGAS